MMTRLLTAAALKLAMAAPSYAHAFCKLDLTEGTITCDVLH